MASTPLLEVQSVSKMYRRKGGLGLSSEELWAVRDVSMEIQPGETVAVVGESGSGKSTVARIAVGLVKPTAGSVWFKGAEVTGLSGASRREWRRHVQMVFQDPYGSLDPRQSVEAAIREPLDIYGIGTRAERNSRVTELLDSVALPNRFRHMRPHALSGGMRQRVAIATALASSPDLIVADEPVSALDVSVQAQILDLLAHLREERGLGMMFISHDLGVVKELADRIVVMRSGEVVESGSVDEIFAAPREEYTQLLLDAVLTV